MRDLPCAAGLGQERLCPGMMLVLPVPHPHIAPCRQGQSKGGTTSPLYQFLWVSPFPATHHDHPACMKPIMWGSHAVQESSCRDVGDQKGALLQLHMGLAVGEWGCPIDRNNCLTVLESGDDWGHLKNKKKYLYRETYRRETYVLCAEAEKRNTGANMSPCVRMGRQSKDVFY